MVVTKSEIKTRGETDWTPVKEESKAAFEHLELLVSDLGKEDPRWKVTIHKNRGPGLGDSIEINYYHTEEAVVHDTDIEALHIHAGLHSYRSSGFVTLSGNEAWQFAKAEEVWSKVGEVFARTLVEAGFVPKRAPYAPKEEARRSRWSINWNIYPTNHPLVAKPAA